MAGTVTQSSVQGIVDKRTKHIVKQYLMFTCVGDADGGSYPATALNAANLEALAGWFPYQAYFIKGGTVPTTGFDITLVSEIMDGSGGAFDISDGKLSDIDTAANRMVNLGGGSTGYIPVPPDGFTFTVANNDVNSAAFKLIIVFDKP